MTINEDLSKLKEEDLLSILMYGLYKLSDNPTYSTIGELVYVLDRNSLYKLCSQFGGCTIRIPTLEELKLTMKTLLVYESVYKGNTFEKACIENDAYGKEKEFVINMFKVLTEVLKGFSLE